MKPIFLRSTLKIRLFQGWWSGAGGNDDTPIPDRFRGVIVLRFAFFAKRKNFFEKKNFPGEMADCGFFK